MEKLNLNILTSVLGIVKCSHWMSEKHRHHKILDELYSDLQKDFDEFVESLIGKFGSFSVEYEDVILKDEENNILYTSLLSEEDLLNCIERYTSRLINYLSDFASKDSGLSSIFDDIKNHIYKALYQLRMS